jgi:hypothetical protein
VKKAAPAAAAPAMTPVLPPGVGLGVMVAYTIVVEKLVRVAIWPFASVVLEEV